MNEQIILRAITITLNQCWSDFAQDKFTRLHLLEMARQNEAVLIKFLNDCAAKGCLKILRPISDAKSDEVCVEMYRKIE